MVQGIVNQPGEMTVEIRAFSFLKVLFDERGWPFPIYVELAGPCSTQALAEQLELPQDKIEAVFINGLVHKLPEGMVKPGDRIAFIPPGTPGPYRVFLGMTELPEKSGAENG